MGVPTRHPDVVPFRLAGYQGQAVAGFEGIVHTRLLPTPEVRVREGRTLRESNSRITARLSFDGGPPLLLKVHRSRTVTERLLALVRPGRALSEWDAARFLGALGVPVPEALAVGERRSFGLLDTSFFVARFLDGVVAVSEELPRRVRAEQRVLLDRLADLIRGMHDRGFDHRDLHTGNVLMGRGPAATCDLVVTDLHRSSHGRRVPKGARRRGTAQWLHSLRDEVGAAGRLRWLRRYAGGLDRDAIRARFRAMERRIDRFERIRLRSRGKRCFKESTVYTRMRGDFAGWRRRDLPTECIEAALRAHGDSLEPGTPAFAKRSRKGVVTRHGDLVVKERRALGALDRLRDRAHPGRHASGYRNAHRLAVRGVGTATPLAFVRHRGGIYTLYEDLSDRPRLDHLARRVFRDNNRAARADLLRSSADWLRRLHRLGVYHGDLKGVNVLVSGTRGRFAFHLIDTDRCLFSDGPIGLRRRVKNLSQLAASIPRCVTRTDRLRWYRRYAEGTPLADMEARVARDVAAQLDRKILVVDDPHRVKILWTVSNWKRTGPLEPSLDLAAAVHSRDHRVLVAVGRPPRGRDAEAAACVRERGLDLAETGARLAKHSAPLRDRSDALRLKRYLYGVRPDLAVATQRSDHRLLLRAARGKAAVPVARLWFGDGHGALDRRDLAALRASAAIFVFCDAGHRQLLEAGIASDRITRTDPPLDLRTVRKRAAAASSVHARLGLPAGRFVFGIVARLQTHRRFELLWEALEALRAEGLDVHLLVVGRGTHQDAVARQPIARRGLDECVTLTGYLRGEEYASTVGSFDAQVFLVPGSDPTCRALREGMALGVPSVATTRGMLPEIVIDGETGLLCEESAPALAAAMRALATDPERARRFGDAARARATRVFDAQRVAADVLAALPGRRGSPP